ncbi:MULTISPECIES: MBL fold metallo-hydrolase [unclassified Agrococcus]|uniref:MBL fold metallo-hydrolase n=1 Tax=unclassified Agrococcus TaxID=2615065 RepID=UPI003609FD34
MLHRDAAPGIHRLAIAATNLYLVEVDDRVLLVDAGLPAAWRPLHEALHAIGRTPDDLAGVLLTHGHFDHVGLARRIAERWSVPVWSHPADVRLARHPYGYLHERARLPYPVLHPTAIPGLVAMTAAGALTVRGVEARPIDDDVPLPADARILEVPGHTDGSIAIHLPERDALLTGDALVTLDPYTGVRGPQIVAGAATARSAVALDSLDALAATGATRVLTGHGPGWRGGIDRAVEAARRRGAH